MARKSNSRAAQGAGTIRKKTVTRSGAAYTYWEARITTGYDPGTGRQIQRSFSGKTQKEVREKMQAAAVELNSGTYKEPLKMTVGEWLDVWLTEYLGGVKPMTVLNYTQHVNNHIKPALGAIKLEALNTHEIQSFYNDLQKPHGDKAGLSAKTVKCVNGVLHKALQQAVAVGYLRFNPADACKLPRVERKEIKPLDSEAIAAFMKAVEGSRYETLYLVQNKHSTRSVYEASETMLIFVIMGGQWMDGLFDEPSARAVNSSPPSCYKDSIEQVAPAMPRARHEPN